EDYDQLGTNPIAEHRESSVSGVRKVQHVEPLPHLVTEALPEQVGHIRLIVNDQDADAHHAPRDWATRRLRGSRTVNSVKDPGSLSTWIVPPCCCVTTS